MEPENPLLLPRMIWQWALVVTLLLAVVRAGIYVRDKRRAAALEAADVAADEAAPQDAERSAAGGEFSSEDEKAPETSRHG